MISLDELHEAGWKQLHEAGCKLFGQVGMCIIEGMALIGVIAFVFSMIPQGYKVLFALILFGCIVIFAIGLALTMIWDSYNYEPLNMDHALKKAQMNMKEELILDPRFAAYDNFDTSNLDLGEVSPSVGGSWHGTGRIHSFTIRARYVLSDWSFPKRRETRDHDNHIADADLRHRPFDWRERVFWLS